MASIPQLSAAMERVLSTRAGEVGRLSGFVQRQSKLGGPVFAKTLVLGWLGNPEISLEGLAQVAAGLGVQVSPQAIDNRFTKEAAVFLKQLLEAGVRELICAEPVAVEVLSRFSAVYVDDGTVVALPDVLATEWKGTGERTGHNQAAVKLHVRLDLLRGGLTGPLLDHGRASDRSSPMQNTPLPRGSLRIADLGYFSLPALTTLGADGGYWLSRAQIQVAVFDSMGRRWELKQLLAAQTGCHIDVPVSLGTRQHLPARLLAVRVPREVAQERRRRLHSRARDKGETVSQARLTLADWTILITNVPAHLLSLDEALALAGARWQIELLFKLWKQHGRIDECRSRNHWRILCEFYAKLIGMLIQHWVLLLGAWRFPNRSLVKAAATVRANAALLVAAFRGCLSLEAVIEHIQSAIAYGCRINTRRREPNTCQILLLPSLGALA